MQPKMRRQLIAVSRGWHRGVMIMESAEKKFVFFLEAGYRYEFDTLKEATQFIDMWMDLKKN